MFLSLKAGCCAALLLAASSMAMATGALEIAVTMDDLPWQRVGAQPDADIATYHRQLMAQLKQAQVPITGFVNEDKLEMNGKVSPVRLAMLKDWLDAGHDLGNHTYGHVGLNDVGLAEYQAATLRGERQLRPLMATFGQAPRWFRPPYLQEGRTPEEHAALSGFLKAHGYQIAPVTVPNSEWIWALAYDRVLSQPKSRERDATLTKLHDEYVPYMVAKVRYYENLSIAQLGYARPQIWLMHANTLNAVSYVDLINAVKRQGYRLISLDQAMQEAGRAKADEDSPKGRASPSWLPRWATPEEKSAWPNISNPAVPPWVLNLADIKSE